MLRSWLPSPARVPVQVTGMLVVPENVHVGSPPFLKCGLAARAAEEVRTNAASITGSAKRTIRTRRMLKLPLGVFDHPSHARLVNSSSPPVRAGVDIMK